MNWNLKNRMLVPAVALLVVVTSGLVALSIWTSREALNRALDEQLTALADSTLEQVEHWLSAQQANVNLWAAQPENLAALGSLPGAENARRVLNEQFARAAKTHECFEQIQIADLKGETIASSHPDYIGKINVADRPYFQEALAGRTVVSDALTSKMSGHPIVVVAAPILDRAEVRGVLYAVVDLNWFSAKIIDRIKLLQTGYACLFDHQGRLLAHPDATRLLRTKLGDYEWGREVLARPAGLIDYTIDGVAKHAAVKIGERRGWGVLVGYDF